MNHYSCLTIIWFSEKNGKQSRSSSFSLSTQQSCEYIVIRNMLRGELRNVLSIERRSQKCIERRVQKPIERHSKIYCDQEYVERRAQKFIVIRNTRMLRGELRNLLSIERRAQKCIERRVQKHIERRSEIHCDQEYVERRAHSEWFEYSIVIEVRGPVNRDRESPPPNQILKMHRMNYNCNRGLLWSQWVRLDNTYSDCPIV